MLMDEDLLIDLEEVTVDTTASLTHQKVDHLESGSLQCLLDSWELGHLNTLFEDLKINMGILLVLSKDDFDELANKMVFGEKVLFKYHYQKWRSVSKFPALAQQISTTSQNSLMSLSPSSSNTAFNDEDTSNPKINVMYILQQHKMGGRILENYQTTNKMTSEHRSLLIRVIVEYFQANDINMSTQISYNIEKQILQIFPTEKLEFYRTERRGKIYNRYINNKKVLKSFKKTPEKSSTKENHVPENDDQMLLQSINYDDLSAKEFHSTWAACSQLRFSQINNDCQTMHDAFKLWPQYKGIHSVRLIDSDFNKMFKTVCKNSNMMSWKEKFVELFNYLKTDRNIRDPNFRRIMDLIKLEDLETGNDNSQLKVMWCLHHILFPTKKGVRVEAHGKKTYKNITVRDSQEHFIFINQTMQSLEQHVSDLRNKKVPIQPFILGLGDVKNLEVKNFFLYLDGTFLPFNSFVRALDICFKVFHIFNVKYPRECSQVWLFLEQFLYDLEKTSEKSSKVSLLIKELQDKE